MSMCMFDGFCRVNASPEMAHKFYIKIHALVKRASVPQGKVIGKIKSSSIITHNHLKTEFSVT